MKSLGPNVQLRAAAIADVPALFALVRALADYERLPHEVTGNAEQLREHLFGDRAYAEAMVAETAGDIVGFALFFPTYSTFRTQPGIHLEDLFVLPDWRGRGMGRGLLAQVAGVAIARGCGRLEWNVLDWNAPAIGFYEAMGADVLPDWRTCRVSDDALQRLGRGG